MRKSWRPGQVGRLSIGQLSLLTIRNWIYYLHLVRCRCWCWKFCTEPHECAKSRWTFEDWDCHRWDWIACHCTQWTLASRQQHQYNRRLGLNSFFIFNKIQMYTKRNSTEVNWEITSCINMYSEDLIDMKYLIWIVHHKMYTWSNWNVLNCLQLYFMYHFFKCNNNKIMFNSLFFKYQINSV